MGVGVNRPGAFAEYIALPMTNIWRHHVPREAIADVGGDATWSAAAAAVG